MNVFRITLLLILLGLSSACAFGDPPRIIHIEPPERVLFVGNSFTFYNNGLHTHLRKLLQVADTAGEHNYAQKIVTISGARLQEHADSLPGLLRSFKPDVVALQGHSLEPIDPQRASAFRLNAKQMVKKVRSAGATPVLFMTWAYSDKPEMTDELALAYDSLGNELNVLVVPAGLAFAKALEQIPGVSLYNIDKRHPTLEGTYLTASVFYAALYSRSPVELAYTAGLDEKLARQLREVAWLTVRNYYGVSH